MTDSNILTVPASRFISSEVNKFSKSHTRLYLALILDVIHAHNGVKPAGYAAMLMEVAPHLTLAPKYCTVIKPALSGKHAETLAEFPATAKGLDLACAWYENATKEGGYSLSLEDMVRYMGGKWSVRAQREQSQQASDTISAAATAARAAQATEETARKALADSVSHGKQNAAQEQAQVQAGDLSRPALSVVPPMVGALLGQAHQSHMICVHDTGTGVVVTGLDTMDLETLFAAMESIEAFVKAAMEAQGVALAA